MINIGIIGATGYTGVELMRLLAGHSHASIKIVTSRTEQGKPVSELFPALRGIIDLEFSAVDSEELYECDLVFFATPSGTAMTQAPALLDKGIRVIDLSVDFRLRNDQEWTKWYGQEHTCSDLLETAVYGLPEMNRDKIRTAELVANPGCYPTAILLGFLPLLEQGLVDTDSLIADAKSGISGAGRKATMTTQFCESSDAFMAYSAGGHRHLPEILQGLQSVCSDTVGLVFVPHLLPIIRGIHATLYATLKDNTIDLQNVYEQRYKDEPFVDVMSAGSHPNTNSVRGNNFCRLATHLPQEGSTAVILAVEDNLVKGAAGQAVQNMNIMFNLPETTGLLSPALYP